MTRSLLSLALFALVMLPLGCSGSPPDPIPPQAAPTPAATPATPPSTTPESNSTPMTDPNPTATSTRETATFGAGCFWCTEAVLEQVEGVLDVQSGYMGGTVDNPTYQQVCEGNTGHAEVVQVTFDPTKLPYAHLLEWFWKLHDPTTLNRQGHDVGTQYRSAIFFHSDAQRVAAEASKATAQNHFVSPIVTEITPASAFYPAEEYHQDFYRGNRTYGYCRAVIAPKLDKLGLDK